MTRTVTVVFSNGQARTYENVPDDVTPDEVEERANADFPGSQVTQVVGGDLLRRELSAAIASRETTIDGLREIAARYGRSITPAQESVFQGWIDYAADNPSVSIPDDIYTPPVSRTEAVGLGVGKGLTDVLGTLTGAQENILRFFGGTPENAGSVRGRMLFELPELFDAYSRLPNFMRAQEQRAPYVTGGEITGGVLGTAPVVFTGAGLGAALGSRIATFAPRTGELIRNFFLSTRAGGTGVRAPTAVTSAVTPVAATRGGRVALRVGGGATAGAAGAALTDADVSREALIGGAIPIIGTIGRRGAGTVYDFLRGRLGEVRAGEVMRNLIADKSEEIIAALRSATDDVRQSTAQFLAERGLLTPELAAATRVAQASAFGKPLETQALQRAAARRAQQAELRGGETAAEAAENVNAMRQAVREETDPMRQSFMERADIGRTQIVPAEETAQRLRGDVQREIDAATRFANDANWSMSVRQRLDDARSAEEIAANLRAQGLAPLDISGVVGSLRQQAREAAFVSPQREQLLSRFADALENRAAMFGGIIDAAGLHLAKRNIGEFVSSTLGQADPSAIARGTSMLAGQAQKLIDDAFETAAGPEWGQYNRAFSSGMQRVEQQEFARRLADLTPQRFERVMADGDPDFVSGFFPNKFRVSDVLPPELLEAARRRNRQVAADLDVAEFGLRDLPRELRGGFRTGAQARVEGALAPGLTPKARAFFNVTGRIPGISGAGFATEQVARDYSQQMAENAMRNLVPGLAQPSEALRLVGVRGANERTANLINAMTPMQQAITAQTVQNIIGHPSLGYTSPAESEIPEDQFFMGFQTGPNGEQIPIYAPARVQR